MSALLTAKPEREWDFLGGGKVESYHEGKLFATIMSEPSREHVDAWFEEIEKIYNNWEYRIPVLLLIDATWGATTPHFRQRTMQLNALAMTLPIKTRTAFLVGEDYTAELQVFATLTGSGTGHRLAVFTEREEAIAWLEEKLL